MRNKKSMKSINTVYEKTAINFLKQIFPSSNNSSNVVSNEIFRNKDFLKINKGIENAKNK